ncbi:major facilitator superfamily domain-containing protein [Dichomitus squalens]|uniref:Major facilitator superfamily domain-containing protein n=1 Tax=Dichomitus squalens TaxID=114155 RepID=A0A4Q9Q826_9APHY|nr:major facilitator superfamily domain-containing protein [Dichomitus squalens]
MQASAFNFPGLIVARLALGFFEAGFSPSFPVYLSLFYTREEFGFRTASWFMFSAVAGAFGGLIAFGIQHIHAAIASWRLLFIVEGVPSILLGILAFKILPDRPEETSLLTEREREIAVDRMNRGGSADVGRVLQKSMCSDRLLDALLMFLLMTFPRTEHIAIAFRDWKVRCDVFDCSCTILAVETTTRYANLWDIGPERYQTSQPTRS